MSFDVKFTRPGKALRMRVDIARLAERFNMRSQNRASKDANLVFYLSVFPLFTLQASDYDVFFDFCVDSASLSTSFKTCNVVITFYLKPHAVR